jgi:hypothetical protein
VSPLELAMFWFGTGLCAGMLLVNWLWKVKIHERAGFGHRLKVDGRLYEVHRTL